MLGWLCCRFALSFANDLCRVVAVVDELKTKTVEIREFAQKRNFALSNTLLKYCANVLLFSGRSSLFLITFVADFSTKYLDHT